MSNSILRDFAFVAPGLLFAMVAHEVAHGYAALRQGDRTAQALGRLTLNPLKHLDPFFSVLMPAFLYFTSGVALGGAKPVPVDPRNYRHPRRGDIIVSLAGVATNLVLAVLSAVLVAALGLVARGVPVMLPTLRILQVMAVASVEVNLALFAFNLIPIPPLDGSHVFKYILPPGWAFRYQRMGFLGLVLLLFLLRTPFVGYWFEPTLFARDRLLQLVSPFLITA